MFPEKLIEPISESLPAGEEGIYSGPFQELAALDEYVAARLALSELERLAKIEYGGENADAQRKTAQSNVEDGRRRVERAEATIKQIAKRAPTPDSACNELRAGAERMLCETGKDLRLVQHLALAWTIQHGIAGFEDGLRLADALIERYGTDLYPKPDEDDASDVSAREMVVSEILNGDAFLGALRECVLIGAPQAGKFSGRDVDVIEGAVEDDGAGGARSVSDIAAIGRAAAGGTDEGAAEALRGVIATIESCEAAAETLTNRFAAGNIHGERVPKLLQRMRKVLKAAEDELSGGVGTVDPIVTKESVQASHFAGATHLGALRDRNDARKLILEISSFLEKTEPSHPAPFFLRRAERLLGAKDFFAIMRDMAPDAIGEMERITGHREPESDSN